MADQTLILTRLCEADAPLTVDALMATLKRKERGASKDALRREVTTCLGRLMKNKLAERCNPVSERGQFPAPKGIFRATAAGRKLIASGEAVTSGPKGNLTGVRTRKTDTFRARLWAALRAKKKAATFELIELARTSGDKGKHEQNTYAYLKALVRAGVAAQMKTREKGFAVSSPGFARFALVKDLGPLAPTVCGEFLFDNNARERIAYRADA